MNLVATANDAKATIKIKVPKRDENGNLVYDTDGTTIIYEEKSIESGVASEVSLNKLGEQDTNITVSVTAEDGETKNEYNVVIKRPFGTIKGNIYTAPTADKGVYKSDIRLYNSSDTQEVIDWNALVSGSTDDIHDKLLTLESQNYTSNDDGTYEIYVIPGTYDILLDKPGYLDHIYKTKVVQEGDTIDLGQKELIAGDINKDGVIQILDLSYILSGYGVNNTDPKYDFKVDFNEDTEIQILDLSIFLSNYSLSRQIE